MPLILTSGPATEPVTLAEAKAHLRVDQTVEDALIASLILTSRLHIEAALGLALITQSWRLHLDAWPRDGAVGLAMRPLQAVTAIQVRAADGVAAIVPPSDYLVDPQSTPARVLPINGGFPAPGRKVAGIEINFTAGYGLAATDVPAPIRQALLMLIAHWYEHRDPIEVGQPATRVPAGVSELLLPYRVTRL